MDLKRSTKRLVTDARGYLWTFTALGTAANE